MARLEDTNEIDPDLLQTLQRAIHELTPVAIDKLSHDEASIFTSGENKFLIALTSEFNCTIKLSKVLPRITISMNFGLIKFYKDRTYAVSCL
jgi:hypothetical protein